MHAAPLKQQSFAAPTDHAAVLKQLRLIRPEPRGCGESYLLTGEMHLNIGVHQVPVLSYEGLLDVSHYAGIHLGEALCAVDPHMILSPLPLGRDPLW